MAAAFPTDCSACHSTKDWLNAVFNHSATKFPLAGAHAPLACSACHANGQFATLATTCVSCHLKNFQATKNPPHTASGFPQTCEVCHTSTAWSPATFSHGTTKFPLTGAHVNTPCASCHIGNVFAGTPTDCYHVPQDGVSDHQQPESRGGRVPDHLRDLPHHDHLDAERPSRTASSRSLRATTPDSPAGIAIRTPSNYQVFTCTNCHTHTQADTDRQHRGIRNYVYSSPSCYSCHPTGRD